MQIYTLLSRLLDYPDAELMANLPEIIQLLKQDPAVSTQERDALMQLISWMLLHDLTGLQAEYVQTFDMTPEHDLHLTHHLFGDDRGRGPALIDLSEHYKGLRPGAGIRRDSRLPALDPGVRIHPGRAAGAGLSGGRRQGAEGAGG